MSQLNQRHFLRLLDFTPAEIDYLLSLAGELKRKEKRQRNAVPER